MVSGHDAQPDFPETANSDHGEKIRNDCVLSSWRGALLRRECFEPDRKSTLDVTRKMVSLSLWPGFSPQERTGE